MKMQCPTENSKSIRLWQNEPSISTSPPHKVDLLDLTSVPEGVEMSVVVEVISCTYYLHYVHSY